jgi:hypothetical protein
LVAAGTLSGVDGRSQVAGLGAWTVRDDDNTSIPSYAALKKTDQYTSPPRLGSLGG